MENPAPFVTASAWIIIDDSSKGEMLFGRNEHEPRQVASLTKIMTAYVVLQLMDHFSLSEHLCMVRILEYSSSLIGTSAGLMAGDRLTVWELLHGMMLPSGNDAAQSLGIHFGLLLLKQKANQLKKDAIMASRKSSQGTTSTLKETGSEAEKQ